MTHDNGYVTKVIILCTLWYLTSISNNLINKLLLNRFPYPITITIFQLVSITLYSRPFLRKWSGSRVHLPWRFFFKFIVPLALGKFMSTSLSHLSVWKVPVSYAHTVKGTSPLFTVILSRVIMGEKQTSRTYLSLIPIISGVVIATLTEIRFDVIGLVAALMSTMGFSLQSIFSKKVLRDSGVHHLVLMETLARVALIIFVPFWVFMDVGSIVREPLLSAYQVPMLLFLDGLLNWSQNLLAFSLIALVSPLTYSVAGASKRVFVIGFSLLILGNPVTWVNVGGMLLAIAGIFMYNKVKYDQMVESRKETLLPLAEKPSNNNILMNGYSHFASSPNRGSSNYFLTGVNASVNGHVNGYANGYIHH